MMTTKSDGGPSDYYDFPKAETLNDALEYLGENRWKGDSFHLANIVKATWRWGTKEGTTIEYDLRKIIYSACRLLMKYKGKELMRSALEDILNDPQFIVTEQDLEDQKKGQGKVPHVKEDEEGDYEWVVVYPDVGPDPRFVTDEQPMR